MTFKIIRIIIIKSLTNVMNNDLDTFNFFIDDLLFSDAHLLKHELDLLLMQYIFNSIDLKTLNTTDMQEDITAAA